MWNELYSNEFTAYGTNPNDFLKQMAHKIPDGPVLCLAEGEGRNAVYLAQEGHLVTAVDLSEVGLRNAAKLAATRGVELTTILADLSTFEPGVSKWAAIVSIWAHMPSAGRARLHKTCVNALIPGGVMILEAYTPRQLTRSGKGGPSHEDLLMTPEALRQEFDGLNIELCEEIDRDIQEGKNHVGPSTTVQFFATHP